jgi:hypothetical protein
MGIGLFIRYQILAPARAAAFNLESINGITVGQTSEAELLGRSAFQTADRECFHADCFYHMETENKLLSRLHLAPATHMSTSVWVRDGMVTSVLVSTKKKGQTAVSFRQVEKMPSDCNSNPCVKRLIPPNKTLMGIAILFNSDSAIRNHMPEVVNSECFSRLHGCKSSQELLPFTKDLNLEATAH